MACTPYIDTQFGRVTVHTTAGLPTGADRYPGKIVFNSTTSSILMWSGSAWEVLDEPPQTYPAVTVTQGVTVAGTLNANSWYERRNHKFEAYWQWASTGAGTAGQVITITTPLTLANSVSITGSFHVLDSGIGYHAGKIEAVSTTSFRMIVTSANAPLGVAPAFTLASGDTFYVHLYGRYA